METMQASLLTKIRAVKSCDRTLIIGIYGPQGSGKTTLSHSLVRQLTEQGLKAQTVSQDDFYLSKAARQELAAVHPLLKTRGVPGTHDVALGLQVFDDIKAGRSTRLPVFLKEKDDLAPLNEWLAVDRLDVLIFEGWCVGVPQTLCDEILHNPEPVNTLEAQQDQDGRWRRYITEAHREYQPWYDAIDYMIGFKIPDFACVSSWRWQQERELGARTGRQLFKNQEQVNHFIAHYERITLYAQNALFDFCDSVISINQDHQWQSLEFVNETPSEKK